MKPQKELTRDWGEQLVPNKLIPAFILQGSISRYIWAGQFVEGKNILDIGCGSGYGTNYLKTRGARSAMGGDISPEAITYAGKRYKENNLQYVVVDAERLPFCDNSFDVVISFEVIEHMEQYSNYVAECLRVLRSDGLFICSTPNAQAAGSDHGKPLAHYHHKEFVANELHDLLGQHFRNVELLGFDPQQPYDKLVYRMATVLQSIIFKIPKIYLLTNLVTLFVFKKYHLLKMGDAETDIERVTMERLQPYTIRDNAPMPGDLIAIGTGKR